MNIYLRVVAFIDRNYNLLFNRRECIRLNFKGEYSFTYNMIICDGATYARCLGNGWFKRVHK